jgi:hypothetical protein
MADRLLHRLDINPSVVARSEVLQHDRHEDGSLSVLVGAEREAHVVDPVGVLLSQGGPQLTDHPFDDGLFVHV